MRIPRLIALIGLALLVALGLRTTVAPSPRSPQSPADFSLDNALAHVRAIATQPHPVASASVARVRQYLADQLSKLGLRVEVQSGTVFGVPVQNVIGVLRGTESTAGRPARLILLVSHYDSVPFGPGAGDDTAAVAALLETLRCLRAGPPVKQDVMLLLTDGEEAGLLGARLFCNDVTAGYKFDMGRPAHDPTLSAHPDLDRVAIVLNFDARGTSGPSIMYETGPGNLELIRYFAAAAPPWPVANSLSYDVYKMLRNDSDFTVFRRGGKQGLNFAFIGNYFYYHTSWDAVENLNPGSVFHDGTYALTLARHFANLDSVELTRISSASQPNAVYFNLPPLGIVHYPATWTWPLTILQLVLTVAAFALAARRRALSGRGLAGAAARLVLALILAPAAVFGLASLLRPPHTPGAFDAQLIAIAAVVLAISLTAAGTPLNFVHPTRGQPPRTTDRCAVVLIVLAIAGIAVDRWLPGGSFLFLWPGIFLALNLLFLFVVPCRPWIRVACLWFAALPTALVFLPLAVVLFTALTMNVAWLVSALSVALVLVAWMLLAAHLRFTPPLPPSPPAPPATGSTAPDAQSMATPTSPA